jgi:hypothetical protein
MGFNKAIKIKQWLRLAIDGISGSGKTYTALATAIGMAKAMKGKIALIDSEHGSASLYADRFDFDTLELTSFQIEDYIEALKEAEKNGYEIVIIDSTSHAWDALVERVERIAHHKFNGNTFRAWTEGTPLQKKLIEAMLTYPGHIIATCRSKTEYSVEKDEKNKTTVKKVGTAAVQRQGFEYEFTMAMTMDINHVGAVTKDRTGKFQDKFIEKPGEDFGKQLIAWLNEGAAVPYPQKTAEEQFREAMAEIGNILDSEDAGNRIFTVEEKDSVQKKIKEKFVELKDNREQKLAYLKEVLEEQRIIFHERLDGDGATVDTNTENQETTPAPVQETTSTTTEEPPEQTSEAQPPADDHFEDEIPWDEKENPSNGKPASLKDEFQKAIRENAKANASQTETADAGASEQLDIF